MWLRSDCNDSIEEMHWGREKWLGQVNDETSPNSVKAAEVGYMKMG